MLLTDIVLISISLAALLFAAITDIRIKEVPDWLSYSLIASGLTIRLIHSLIFSEPLYFGYGVIGLISMAILGNILYFTKQWGGGDAKLLMGLGSTISTRPAFLPPSNIPFLGTVFFLIILTGAIYGVIWTILLILKDKNKFKQEFLRISKTGNIKILQLLSIIAAFILLILVFFIQNTIMRITLFLIAIIAAFYISIFLTLRTIENLYFYKKVKLDYLVEGDWIAEDIKIKDKVVFNKTKMLTKNDLRKLKELNIEKVIVKDGIPFVPPFLIGTVLALIIPLFF